MQRTQESEAPALRPPPLANPAVELASALGRRKGLILFVFVIVTGVVALGASSTPPLYEATSSLMVRIGREYVYRPEVGRSDTARAPSLSEMVNSEVEILNSHDLAEQVVLELGVDTLYPELLELEPDPELAAERATLNMRRDTTVKGVLESSVIKVSFEHTDPQVAADAVNLLVERFKDKHLEVFGEEQSSFLEDQMQRKQTQLAEAEQRLADFKRTNSVFDLGEQRVLLLGQRARLEDELRTNEVGLAELRMRVGDVPPSGDADLPPDFLRPEMKDRLITQLHTMEDQLRALDAGLPDRSVDEAKLRLLELRLQESQLLRNYAETNRNVQTVREDIRQVEEFLKQAEGKSSQQGEGYRARLTQDIAACRHDLQALIREEDRDALRGVELQLEEQRRRTAELNTRIATLDQQEKTLRQLERDLSTAEAEEQTYRQRVEEARITEELDREKRINVRVIERASRPLAPTGLSRNLKIAMGAFVGLIAGAAAALFLELFRPRT